MAPWEDYLRQIYYNPTYPTSYEGEKAVYKRENKYRISHGQIRNWLQNQDAYSLNKAVKRNFHRGRVIVSGIDDQWDADLASFARDSDENDGYRYLLVVIDIFSRLCLGFNPLKIKLLKKLLEHSIKYYLKVGSLSDCTLMLAKNSNQNFSKKTSKLKIYLILPLIVRNKQIINDSLKLLNFEYGDTKDLKILDITLMCYRN